MIKYSSECPICCRENDVLNADHEMTTQYCSLCWNPVLIRTAVFPVPNFLLGLTGNIWDTREDG
jgi:hypothetical protein